jgi:DNA-binding transcriptional MerR regulator
VGEYSRSEAAERAGISLEDLNQLVQLGILAPRDGDRFTGGDVRRLGLVHSLEDAGIPLDRLAAAVVSGELSLDFMDEPAYERFAALTTETFQELANRTGISVDLLMVVREAIGSAQPGEVVVTQAVVEASEGAGASFTEIGTVELKGVGGTMHLHSAHRA